MYDKVSTSLDFVDRENDVRKFWKDNDIFKKSINKREGNEVFTFYDGPPTANGKPHIGHIITRAVKDIIPRYKTMKGYKVLRKAGWDTHGLPVELEVEKLLGINGKPAIEEYGVEPFIKKCKESVWKYEQEWREMSDSVGFWADMDQPYVTYHNNYIESVWWALKTISDKGLLYKGHKIVPYCPRCGTALSSHEVAQGYKDVKELSVYAKFKVKNTANEYLIAWTTTPWTLPSNVALVVNANETYAKAESNGEIYILAESLLETVLGSDYTVLDTFLGKTLEFLEYEQLFDFAKVDKKAFYVACDDYVTLTDGTGIVHTAPAFGEDDARVGRLYDLPFVQLVDEQGKFIDEVDLWKGIFVKDADPKIISHMKETKKLFKSQPYEHSYPFCWRCDTPLLYYARSTWFIEMTKLRKLLVANNNTVNWLPDNIREGRFGNFLENVIDWGLSRERYWGTPLPIWECECGHRHTIGSIKELQEMATDAVADDIELHKPYIDRVFLNCAKCGGTMRRVSEVVDCWFDSGSMPFAQWHYPFENKEIFDENFPADFISEAVDQTRGWFYSLIAISTILFDKSPFKNAIVLGHVLDKDGQKMSKHKGNVVDPWLILNKQGADAVRWYFFSGSAPWLPSRFYEEAVNESQRKFMGTFWNTYAFFVLYANIDEFDATKYDLEYDKLQEMDRWVLSRLNSLVQTIDRNLNNYRITESARELQDFVDAVSNWYVRRSRERFWGSEMTQDKVNAYMTLYTVLVTLSKLSAPFVPYMSEAIYRNIVVGINKAGTVPESVHLCDFPTCCERFIDKELEQGMDAVLSVVVLGRAARNTANIKNRQPISRMFIKTASVLTDGYVGIIAEELNIKSIEFTDDVSAFTAYKLKPQMRTLGPKYGKALSAIGQHLAAADGNKLIKELRENNILRFTVNGVDVELTEEDLLIESAQADGFVSMEDKDYTVVIDTLLTPELIEEGFVRELISKLQTMRKEADFEVLNRITVYHNGNKRLAEVFERNAELISSEVLANEIINGDGRGYVKDWNINGEDVTLAVYRD